MIMMPVIVDLDTKQLTQAGESSRSCNSHSREEIVGNFQGFPVFDRSNLSAESGRRSPSEPLCAGCGTPVVDRFLLKVAEDIWHESCLRCYACGMNLHLSASCFVRDDKVLCRSDYQRIYGSKCARCLIPLNSNDLVLRCLNLVFHVNCFVCSFCGAVLQKGDQYIYQDGQIVCRRDFEMLMQQSYGSNFKLSEAEDLRKGPKRPRTILTSSQRKAFKASFELTAKPCRKVREQLAKETGLSVRVVQVWFQNQRAKMKKVQRKTDSKPTDTDKTGKKAEKFGSDTNSDLKSDAGDRSSPELNDTSSVESSASSPALSETELHSKESVGSPVDSGNVRSKQQSFVPINATPIDKLYSMQNALNWFN